MRRRNEGNEISLTESLVRRKLPTSIVSWVPSLGFSSGFFPLAMVVVLMVVASGSMERARWGW
jgi:hypothetical protein